MVDALEHWSMTPSNNSRYDVIHAIVRSLPLFTAFPFIVRYETQGSFSNLPTHLTSVVSLVPEAVLLWAYPRGQLFKSFSDVGKSMLYHRKLQC
jgi:hypothetical protein